MAIVLILLALATALLFAALWYRARRLAEELAVRIAFLKAQVVGHRREAIQLSAKCGRLQERNNELLDALVGVPSLTESVYADLASLPITDPQDDR